MNMHAGTVSSSDAKRQWIARGDYDAPTTRLLVEIEDWLPVLRQVDLSGADLRRLFDQARADRTTFRAALASSGLIPEANLTQALASSAGVPFVTSIMPDNILAADRVCQSELGSLNPIVPCELPDSGQMVVTLLGPHDIAPPELAELARSASMNGQRMALTPPAVLRSGLLARVSPRLSWQAINGLFEWRPDLSARDRLSAAQGFVAGALVAVLTVVLWLAPTALFIAVHLFSTIFFLACSGLKAAAALFFVRRRPRNWRLPKDAAALPVYSVLVALYREADIVPQLIQALDRLVWPRDRLEIKLVCEADDHATIDAIKALNPASFFEIVEVPPSLPRTKPKALRFAMALTSGEFVVLYDAEDRPHPGQLLEAHARFAESDDTLACLQAPLFVTNAGQSLLARMFAFEYAGLFRAVLPFLAATKRILPLGGTSNHFRKAALADVGGWDPHNVTEDADVGVRLGRFGYRIETITLPTFEAAPDELRVWLPQRTRWLKGWLQTWLVHMRHPARLWSDLGPAAFLLVQVLLAGMFFSALLHPVIFASALVYAGVALAGFDLVKWQLWLLALDGLLLLFSYAVFLVLGWRSLTAKERIGFPIIMVMTPVYWLLISYAAWLALIEFIRYPHRWNKTPHKPG